MSQKPSETVVDAWIALVRGQQAAVVKVERAFRDAGLPPHAWYDVLWELHRAPETGLRPFEIEQRILIAQSNISRLIDRMEERGLVERRACETDGRGQHVVITKAGREMRSRMWPVYARAIADGVGQHLNDKEAATLRDLLTRLTEQGR